MATVVSLLALFGLGTCFALLGSISVKLMPRLNIDSSRFGSLVSGLMFAAIISSLIVGVVLDSIGFKPVAVVGFVAVTIVILLLARGKSYGAVLGASILLGVAAMALNTAGNTLAPMVLFDGQNQAAASNLGNVCFGLGLFLTPLVTSFLFRKTSYENSVSALAILMLLGAVLAFVANDYPAINSGFSIATAFSLLGNPIVLAAGFLLLCYMALETSLTNWLAPFSKEVIKSSQPGVSDSVSDATAANILSVFAIGMMIGRLLSAFIPEVTSIGGYVIAVAALISAVIIWQMIQTKSVGQARVLGFLAGFFFAPMFPTTVGVTFSKVPPEVAGSTFGIIFAIGLLGGVLIPKYIGNAAKGSTIQKSLKVLIPACLILVVLALALHYLQPA